MSSNPATKLRALLRGMRTPEDYFAETRTSLLLWPERIICFSRRNQAEMGTQSLAGHHHHRYILIVPMAGRGEVYVDDRLFVLQPMKSLLIFPFQPHHGFRFRDRNPLWLFVGFDTRNDEPLEALRLQPVRSVPPTDLDILSRLAAAWADRSQANHLAYWLGAFLTRLLEASPADIEPVPVEKISPLLRRINHVTMSWLDRPFNLKDLSRHLALSESYLRSRFRQETGISLGKHLRRLRLQKAMGLLVQSPLTITQVAERCGFESVFTFSRAFRQSAGISARDYRKHYQNPQGAA